MGDDDGSLMKEIWRDRFDEEYHTSFTTGLDLV